MRMRKIEILREKNRIETIALDPFGFLFIYSEIETLGKNHEHARKAHFGDFNVFELVYSPIV